MKAGVARRVGWLVEQGKGAQEAIMEALTRMKQRVGGEGGVRDWGVLGMGVRECV